MVLVEWNSLDSRSEPAANTDTHSHANPYPNPHANANTNSDANTDANTDRGAATVSARRGSRYDECGVLHGL
jgi:hypothetical protein